MTKTTSPVAIVAGAVSNVGQAVAAALRAAGMSLALVDRAGDRLPATYPDLVGADRHLFLTGVDVGSVDSCAAAAERTLAKSGRIDALINTVGAFLGGTPAHEADPADWHAMFDANVKTTLNACRAVIPAMIRQKSGKIGNVANIAALRGEGNVAAYCASKSAVVSLSESLSVELGQHGVNVNCVLPGTLDTPQNRTTMPGGPNRKWVKLEDVAGVIAFLASDTARAIHGAAIPVVGSSV